MQFQDFVSILLVFGCVCWTVPLQAARVVPQFRIVKGNNAALGQFPYQVLLRSKGGVVCGGSIISQNYVLTAAHCINGGSPASDFYILAGTITFDESSTKINVAQLIPHPNYQKPNPYDNDIALLRLSSPLTFNNNIKAIPLQKTEIQSGEPVIVSGWGGLYQDGPLPKTLQYTTERTLNNADCSKRIGNAPSTVLCVEHINGNGICFGDSGGPAAYNGKLAGVASFLINGCASSFPEGFSKISAYLDFIRKNSDVN